MKLTELLGDAGHPVAYYPRLRAVTGSTNATLLLCQLIYWHGKQRDSDGWVEKRGTIVEDDPDGILDSRNQSIEHETGLTYKEQMVARRLLAAKGLLRERRSRLQHRTYFQIDFEALDREWHALTDEQVTSGTSPSDQRSLRESPGGTSPNAQRSLRENPSVISIKGTYIDYTQTTAETTAERAASTSKKEKLELSPSEEGDERIPSTPVEAMRHPDIQLFQEVCGRIPGAAHYQTVIETMRHFRGQRGEGTVEYLRPFWLAWCGRRRRSDGKPYDPGSLTWLTEWALNGTIPPENGGSNERYRRGATAPKPLTATDLAVAEIINARERERERGRPREPELPALPR